MYTIRFFVKGHPHLITLDDEVLFDNKNDELYFSNPSTKSPSLWGPLLEKAWAKMLMNYSNIDAGQSHIALRAILGCPVIQYNFGYLNMSNKAIWNLINYQQDQFVFTL